MKTRIVVGVLAVLSTLALSITGAEAGAGGFPTCIYCTTDLFSRNRLFLKVNLR